MRVHHLNCGTLRPFGGRRVNGTRPPFRTARLVCHCLLVEAGERLVLVDSGFGMLDVDRLRRPWQAIRPRPRLDETDTARHQLPRHLYAHLATRPRLAAEETAVRQVVRLGHAPSDVTDVVLTHLDLDHAGGLPDFRRARVHVDRAELEWATTGATSANERMQRLRYWPYQWAHGPAWVAYDTRAGGESWLGFGGVRELEGLPDMLLVPLPGHSAGQCGVAVRENGRWLFHAADSYFDHREVDAERARSTPGLAGFQKQLEFDAAARRESRQRVRALVKEHPDEVEVFCTHDPVELDRYVGAAA